ncbi:prominin-2 [Copidosoma floridanum]|uniref:prominin-2 n=1 Tax=Copidosoma floridanum TaxID=29053 RepID=UPI0006C96465|nr:prominin-2 [Copidosoma floridanum]
MREYAKILSELSSSSVTSVDGKKKLINLSRELMKLDKKVNDTVSMGEKLIFTVKRIQLNATSMQKAVNNLIVDVEGAQHWFNYDATIAMKKMVASMGASLKNRIGEFFPQVLHSITNEFGRCAPLSKLYNATIARTIVIGCENILDPFNGYWLSIGWCLFLFFPMVILSVKFIGLQKTPKADLASFTEEISDSHQMATVTHVRNRSRWAQLKKEPRISTETNEI